MQILIDSKFTSSIQGLDSRYDIEISSLNKYNCIIGDVDFFVKVSNQNLLLENIQSKILVVQSDEAVNLQILKKISPTAILNQNELHLVNKKLDSIKSDLNKKVQAQKIRDSVEQKRSDLEKLNDFLTYQDKERSSALKVFHLEEQNKKQNEKQLLFFLDFINSNFSKSSFLDELLGYIWTELKKISSFHQMGIILKQNDSSTATIYRYGNKKYYSQKNFVIPDEMVNSSIQWSNNLANILQRPVGKIVNWHQVNQKFTFFLYLESSGKETNIQLVESFMNDRISLLSLIVSRWVTEESEKVLLQQWKTTFKSYKDPIHVIDDDFNIIQSNYSTTNEENQKCYKILAEQDKPCKGCPCVLDNNQSKSVIEINKNEFQVHHSQFEVLDNQSNELLKYSILFYENKTNMNKLKSQVIQSEKMNTIGNLANHLAHELNNPLTGLKLNTELLIDEITTEGTSTQHLISDLKEVLKATIRSETIIKDLLDFSTNESIEIQTVDFATVLKKTMTLLKTALRNVRVFVDVKSHFILVQPVYLQQIIFNLIKNSSEALGSQGHIKIYEDFSDSSFSTFIIEDNGSGITENLQAEIFKPFFTTKKEGAGTGLGLYLCQSLMQKMNAELIYDSKFKSGARFLLRFKKQNG